MPVRPDVVTFNVTMDACSRGHQWERCLALFDVPPGAFRSLFEAIRGLDQLAESWK